MEFAAIDIGTNSTLLLIAEFKDGNLNPLVNKVHITRLGQNVNKTGELQPEAIERTFSVLQMYSALCQKHRVQTILVGGTSALRDARNGEQFVQRVHDKLGLDIRILTGDDEAQLTYLASYMEFRDIPGHFLVLDVGGGSTEFIYGIQEKCEFFKSVNIGSVRLTEKFITSDPPTIGELERLSGYIQKEISTHIQSLIPAESSTTLIGVAGTVTTLLAVELEMSEYEPEKIHRQPLSRIQIENTLSRFVSMPLEQRKELRGLHPNRADVIIAGAAIVLEAMKSFGFEELLVSDRGIRYGLLYDYLQSNNLLN